MLRPGRSAYPLLQSSFNIALLVILIKPIVMVFSTIQEYSDRKSLQLIEIELESHRLLAI